MPDNAQSRPNALEPVPSVERLSGGRPGLILSYTDGQRVVLQSFAPCSRRVWGPLLDWVRGWRRNAPAD